MERTATERPREARRAETLRELVKLLARNAAAAYVDMDGPPERTGPRIEKHG